MKYFYVNFVDRVINLKFKEWNIAWEREIILSCHDVAFENQGGKKNQGYK